MQCLVGVTFVITAFITLEILVILLNQENNHGGNDAD
jgi:hypothetical protein